MNPDWAESAFEDCWAPNAFDDNEENTDNE